MRYLTSHAALLSAGLALGLAIHAHAAIVDGQLDAGMGEPLAVQTCLTPYPDAQDGLLGPASGGELDVLHATIRDGTLHVFVGGNLMCVGRAWDYGLEYTSLDLFIDSRQGGQPVVLTANYAGETGHAGVKAVAGLTFDAGFEPDHWFSCVGYLADFYDPASPYTILAEYAETPAGGGTGYVLGRTSAGGPGVLSGGTNPSGVMVTLDDSNVGGVGHGCGAASGVGVTRGVEWSIPLAALGDPVGCIRLMASMRLYGRFLTPQLLPPLPAGTCTLPSLDLGAYAGDQFATLCPASVPARSPSWGAVKVRYR